MSPDLQHRLAEIAADFERGQAEQPLGQFITALAADFRGPARAILVPLPSATSRPWLAGGEAGVVRVSPAGAWDWLAVTAPAQALGSIEAWNRLLAFSPLVVVVWDGAPGAVTGEAYELLNALANARKRGVTLVVAPATAPTGIPSAFLPAVPAPAFDPAADWSQLLKARPADFNEQIRVMLEGFALERAVLPLAAKAEQTRVRAMAQRAVLDQRQSQLASQRDLGGGRVRIDRARDAWLQSLETMDKELAEESRVFLAPKGAGTVKLKALLDQVGAGLVQEELRPKVCILTVNETQVQLLVKQVEKLFWSHARKTFEQADARVARALEDFTAELKAVLPDAQPPAPPGFEQAKLARNLETIVHANVAYRGELPVKGFFERIQASRQVVFFVVGLFSLVGASAFARNPAVIMVTLALFCVMLFKTTRDFKVEAAEAKERELERLAEMLRAQLRQLLQEMEAMKLNAWRDHLQGLRRAMAAALDQASRDAAANQTRDLDDERQKLQFKLRGLDKLVRDLGTMDQRLQSLLQPARQNRQKAEQAFSQALRGP